MIISENAYAKVNLHLGILGKRDDGFHEISTVMQSVSLADRVQINLFPFAHTAISLCMTNGEGIPSDRQNLAYRAAESFFNEYHTGCSAEIHLEKNIPSQAGLGGGSSDAAAVLRALNRAFGFPLSRETMLRIAASLGSDIPFCLAGGAAICLGRGEIIEQISDPAPLSFVIAKCQDESVSTPVAYRELDRLYADFCRKIDYPKQESDSVASAIRLGLPALINAGLYNIFESVVYEICPKTSRLREKILDTGASAALLCGSGTAVFGIYPSSQSAKSAAGLIGDMAVFAESVPPTRYHL